MDHVAYTPEGKMYYVSDSPIDPREVADIVKVMEERGLSPSQIESNLSQIESIMVISERHPSPVIRKDAKRRLGELSNRDLVDIYLMTQGTISPSEEISMRGGLNESYPDHFSIYFDEEISELPTIEDATLGSLIAKHGSPNCGDWGKNLIN